MEKKERQKCWCVVGRGRMEDVKKVCLPPEPWWCQGRVGLREGHMWFQGPTAVKVWVYVCGSFCNLWLSGFWSTCYLGRVAVQRSFRSWCSTYLKTLITISCQGVSWTRAEAGDYVWVCGPTRQLGSMFMSGAPVGIKGLADAWGLSPW